MTQETTTAAPSLEQRRTDELAAFLAVADGGSFVAGARILRRHATIVSKRIAALERRLGVRLLERTTRRLGLTDAGARFADQLRSAAATIFEAEQEAAAQGVELRGRLKLGFPAAMGRQWLAPALPAFARRYPGLEIDVDYSERHVDLIGEGFDAAVRLGALEDSRFVSRRLGQHRIVLGASPDYLAQAGTPAVPRDLAGHNLLRYTGPVATPEWRLQNGVSQETILPAGNYRSNDVGALVEAACQGVGIAGFGEWSMAEHFASGALIRVLPDWRFQTDGDIHLIRPSATFISARVDAFSRWIVALFADGPPWPRIDAAAGN